MRGFTLFLAASVVGLALSACAAGEDEAAKGRWVIRNLGLYLAVDINDDGQIVTDEYLWEDGKAHQLRTSGRKGTSAHAAAINERGQVVGHLWDSWSWSETKGATFSIPTVWERGRPHELTLLSGPVTSWPPQFVGVDGRPIPFPEGEWGGEATAINDRGQIVGWSDTGAENFPVRHAVLWEDGKMLDLGTLAGGSSEAVAINERGQVIGTSWTLTSGPRAFLWEDGKMRDLGTLGGGSSEAVAINDRGQVVGWSETKARDEDGYISHAFLWEDGKMTDLGTLGGPHSGARAINERGQVVGWADTERMDEDGLSYINHAFLWDDGEMRELGTLGGPNSGAVAINERGQIVGAADTEAGDPGYPIEHAFVWEDGKLSDLGTLGASESEAVEINESGEIVGSSWVKAEEMAVLWTLSADPSVVPRTQPQCLHGCPDLLAAAP